MPTIPGAIGAFRREALLDVGGVAADTLAEDTDLTMAVLRAGWRVVYEETRDRLDRGARRRCGSCGGSATAGATAPCRRCGSTGTRCVEPGAGRQARPARAAVPGRVPGPAAAGRPGGRRLRRLRAALPALVQVAGWPGSASSLLQVLTAAYALRLDRERFGPLWTLPLQQFVYRQLMYLVVVQSVVTALIGIRLRWQRMVRTGEAAALVGAGRTAR